MTQRILSFVIVVVGALLMSSTGSAQQATPPADASLDLLVVQSFDSGRLAPVAGGAGLATLTFEPPMRDALYFTERPNRLVGSYATNELLALVRQAETDPVNGVAEGPVPGGGEVQLVVEVLQGELDPAGTVRYEVRLLGEADQTNLTLEAAARPALVAPIDLGHGHLFIDGLGQHKDNPT